MNSVNETYQNERSRMVFHRTGVNLRNAVRYSKTLNTSELYSRKRFFLAGKPISIKLLDISSRGAKIASKQKLKVNSEFVLKVTFADKKVFEIVGKVIRKDVTDENCYGFKFSTYNAKLGEYLFRTQTEAVFKHHLFAA